jgi:hypothetical protein
MSFCLREGVGLRVRSPEEIFESLVYQFGGRRGSGLGGALFVSGCQDDQSNKSPDYDCPDDESFGVVRMPAAE